MEFRAEIESVSQDLLTKEWRTVLKSEDRPEGDLRGEKSVKITPYRHRRSLSANAYYWHLVGMVASSHKPPTSNNRCHNVLLSRYGVPFLINGELVTAAIPDTDEALNDALENADYHLKPTSARKEGKDGKMFRICVVLQPSHTFNTAEFSNLLDGVISEAKDLGLETLPKEEVDRMMEAYEKHYSNRH